MSKLTFNFSLKFAPFICKVIFPVVFLTPAIFGQAKTEPSDIRPLTVEKPVERELTGDEAHSYALNLQAGQFLNVIVEQKGIDVVVALFDSDNKKITEADSPNGMQGAEIISSIIETDGVYRLEVRAAEKTAPVGRYEAKISELRTATEKDKNVIAAQKVFTEAEALKMQRTAQSLRGAIKKYEEALRLYRSIGDKRGEAVTLNNLSTVYYTLGETGQAFKSFNDVLTLFRAAGDKTGEASTLSNIGAVHYAIGERQEALKYFNEALPLLRAVGDKAGEAATLSNIGSVYSDLGEPEQALKYFNESLPLRRAVGNKEGEAATLNNIGGVYSALGEKQQALKYYNESLALSRAVGNKFGEAITLNGIAGVYDDLGEPRQSLKYYNEALPIARLIGDKVGEAAILNNIGTVYRYLGEPQQALKFFSEALPISRAIGNKQGEANTLNNIGGVYSALGDRRQALKYYNEALPLFRATGDKRGEALALHNLSSGLMSDNLRFAILFGKLAVNNYQILRANAQGLGKNIQKTFLKSIEDTYRGVAEALIKQQRYAEAQQVLNSFKDQHFFDFNQSKQLVPLGFTVREAELVADWNQKLENIVAAIRAFDAFKLSIGRRSPTDDETARLKSLADKQVAVGEAYLAFLKTAEKEFAAPPDWKDNTPDVADLREMQAALRETSAATGQNTVAVYTLVGERNFHALIVTTDNIKAVSSQIKNDNDDEKMAKLIKTEVNLKANKPVINLNEKAKQFWALLQTDEYDPTKLGKQLYDVVFNPIEKELPADAKTILWSLDGSLRYVPMAALFDGRRYLVERYNHVNFTRSEKERMTKDVSAKWTGTGFGTTRPQKVSLLGETIDFKAMPGVTDELRGIFRAQDAKTGAVEGEILSDQLFTQKTMVETLKQKRPLVHIASHFSFRGGDESRSFLLLGDGSAFTLAEMSRQTNLFQGVELLTLSACNTAAWQSDANGREIDAFSELAQRLGAGSVLATLWPIADNSTPALMKEFYNLKLNKNLNKAEALRQAQLSLFGGGSSAKPLTVRADFSPVKIMLRSRNSVDTRQQATKRDDDIVFVDEWDAPRFVKNPKKPFSHPFYWAPFILFGNWR
jgi:CHAT domain-containing protein/tetratricopeptide (TPR) repeat protein